MATNPPTAGNYGFVHERFPSPRVRRNVSMMSSYETHSPARNLASEQSSGKVKLPKLVFDNTPLPPRRNINCSYISNHKAYLRTKGFQLSDVYSVNRHRPKRPSISNNYIKSGSKRNKNSSVGHQHFGSSDSVTNLFHPDRNYEFYNGKKLKHDKSSDLWKPYDPRSNREPYIRSLRELDEEIPIPGYVPRDDIHHKRLGRVITSERMRELLSEEEPVIPRGFYSLDAAGIISPRYEI